MKNPTKYIGNELKYIEKVLNSENWSATAGSWTNTLEREFAKKIGVRYAIAMNSGTSTLHSALEALGVGYGDEVIVPSLSVIMDSSSVIHANAIPVYADVDETTFLIDPKSVEKLITSKTKAIIAVSLYGLSPDYDALKKVAKGIPIIEDNAQCFFGTYKGLMTGTIGDFASYSFENSKHLCCGEGGILVTNNEQLAERARKIAGHGFKNLKADEGRVRINLDVFQDPDYKRHDMIGWNYRLSEFNSAIALAQLENSDALIQLRIDSSKYFMDVMDKYKHIFTYQTSNYEAQNTFYTLATIYNGDAFGISWKDFRKAFISNGGDPIFACWALQYNEPAIKERTFVKRNPCYETVDYSNVYCANAEKIQPKIMQFKTNYRDLELAKKQSIILDQTIKGLF